jgi:hypothetical protein
MNVRRVSRAVVALAVTTALSAPMWPASAGASEDAAGETKRVGFRGVTVSVPADWPVRRLGGRPGCVRFDREAVYVGDPTRSTCPPHLVGRTGAVHLTTGSPQGVVAPDRVVTSARSSVTAVVSAGTDAALADRVAASVTFRGGERRVLAPSGPRAARTLAGARATSDARRPTDTTYTGPGFDACTARPLSELATWYQHSPYKAVNMYIGGASRGCAQPELSASWVSGAIAQGWVLIPTYVGLQAPCTDYPNRISPAQASSQGIAAAEDAIAQLNALGLGIGNPVYFDMEAFSYGNATCRQGVLDFLDSWTAQLHYRGYVSGVYVSASSTIRALVSQLGNPAFDQPDDLWIARWCQNANSCDTSTNDPEVPADKWADHQRIRQYLGGHKETWGGVTINIDSNTVDAAVSPSQLAAEGSFVTTGNGAVFRVAGGAPIFTSSWQSVGLPPQPVQTLSPTQFDSLPDRPDDGTFLVGGATGRVYRVDNGVAYHVPSWAPYGGPQPTVTVDQAALDNAGTGGVWNGLTSSRPTVRLLPTEHGSTASRTRFGWTGGITASAVATYDVRWRRAKWNASYGSWTRPGSWQRTPVVDVPLGMRKGWTYCVSVRARNRAGLTSKWTGASCLARALDDRRLHESSGWKSRNGKAYYAGSALVTRTRGASLTLPGANLKRVGLVATTCRTCGRVRVLVDGKKIKTVNLKASRTRRQQVLMLPAFGKERGTVTVQVRSNGRKVEVDGLVVSRS